MGAIVNEASYALTRSTLTVWAGRILSGFAVLFLGVDASIKVLMLPSVLETTVQLGYPVSTILGIWLVQLISKF